MKIVAKSALVDAQIKAKLDLGCDAIEIQLIDDFFENIDDAAKSANEVLSKLDVHTYPIEVVHSPLLSNKSDAVLEDYVLRNPNALMQIAALANYFGERQSNQCIVVLHMYSNFDCLQHNVKLLAKITDLTENILASYPNVTIAIENVTPAYSNNGHLVLCNNFQYDNVRLVSYLRDTLCTTRVGTVLDICHAKMSIKYLDGIYDILGQKDSKQSLSDYFIQNQSVIKLIHLADFTGSGHDKGCHGTVPSSEQMYEFVELYNRFQYSCPVTLEVHESDYLTCRNYQLAHLRLTEALTILEDYK